MVTDIIHRIRLVLAKPGVTPAGLARKAGLHANTLYGAEKASWNPTASTLMAIEPHLAELEALPDAPAEAA